MGFGIFSTCRTSLKMLFLCLARFLEAQRSLGWHPGAGIVFACSARAVGLRFLIFGECASTQGSSPHFSPHRFGVHWDRRGNLEPQHSRACSSPLRNWEEKGQRAALLTGEIPPLVFRIVFASLHTSFYFLGKIRAVLCAVHVLAGFVLLFLCELGSSWKQRIGFLFCFVFPVFLPCVHSQLC